MTLLTNGPFVLQRSTRSEPYEPPSLADLGTFDGFMSKVTPAQVQQAGGVQTQTTVTAVLTFGPEVPVSDECIVTDPQGRVWDVTGTHFRGGVGLDRTVCELVLHRGRA